MPITVINNGNSLSAASVYLKSDPTVSNHATTKAYVDNLIATGSKVLISETPPFNPALGTIWFDSANGTTSIYYDSTWIDIGGGTVGPAGQDGIDGINGTNGTNGTNGSQGPPGPAAVGGVLLTDFTGTNQSKVVGSGYQKLPGGVILQWGKGASIVDGGSVIFPLAFPSACTFVGIDPIQVAVGEFAIAINLYASPTTSGFAIERSSSSYTCDFQWYAIGY